MSWDEHDRRRAAIKAVLAYAEQHPDAGLPFEVLTQVPVIFRDRRELVLALQYEWSRALWARIELLSLERRWRFSPLRTAEDLAATARAECAARNPVLRRLLDRYCGEIGPVGPTRGGVVARIA